MRKFLLLTLSLLSFSCYSQNKLLFEYDTAGNQIKRSICVNCLFRSANNIARPKEIAKLEDKDLIKTDPEDTISYYPNPVKEELFIKWELINGVKVTEIQLYSLSGQMLRNIPKLENQNSESITFQEYPSGIYSVLIIYSNGEQKTLKIIKQ